GGTPNEALAWSPCPPGREEIMSQRIVDKTQGATGLLDPQFVSPGPTSPYANQPEGDPGTRPGENPGPGIMPPVPPAPRPGDPHPEPALPGPSTPPGPAPTQPPIPPTSPPTMGA